MMPLPRVGDKPSTWISKRCGVNQVLSSKALLSDDPLTPSARCFYASFLDFHDLAHSAWLPISAVTWKHGITMKSGEHHSLRRLWCDGRGDTGTDPPVYDCRACVLGDLWRT